jgi:hypothetical protein
VSHGDANNSKDVDLLSISPTRLGRYLPRRIHKAKFTAFSNFKAYIIKFYYVAFTITAGASVKRDHPQSPLNAIEI